MSCQKCGSDRVMAIFAHAKDLHNWTWAGKEGEGYLPEIKNIGSGDDVDIDVCLECGQVQGEWPAPDPEFGESLYEDEPDYVGRSQITGFVD